MNRSAKAPPNARRQTRPTRKTRRWIAGAAVIAAAAVLVSLAVWPSCAVYGPSLLLPADSDGSTADAGGPGSTCAHVSPPARPDAGESDAAGVEVIAAFKTIDIGLTADASAPRPPYGYDLDGVCTCPGPPSCQQEKGAPESCDDDAGRDNTAIDLFRGLGVAASTGTSQIDDGLTSGQYGILLVIDDYNGQPNDPKVVVSYYISNGVDRSSDGGISPPTFTGNDRWTVDPHSLENPPQGTIANCTQNQQCQSAFQDDDAYVSNNFVVAHFSQIPVAFGDRSFLGGATMQLSDAIIVGQLQLVQLQPSGALGYEVAGGTIAGRWPTRLLLSTLATIPDPNVDGSFLCGASADYQIIKAVVCQAADISQNSIYDNATPFAACDAVSVGMQFAAGPAQLGAVLAVPAAPAGCSNGGVPFTDSCQ